MRHLQRGRSRANLRIKERSEHLVDRRHIMRFLKLARHWFWLAPLALGVVFIGAGLYMVAEGRSAHDEVRDAVARENIVTAEDSALPNERIDDAATAKAQADV